MSFITHMSSSGSMGSALNSPLVPSMWKLYWKPEHPPPSTAIRSLISGSSFTLRKSWMRFAHELVTIKVSSNSGCEVVDVSVESAWNICFLINEFFFRLNKLDDARNPRNITQLCSGIIEMIKLLS